MTDLSNPWLELPGSAPYVLPADRPYLAAFEQGGVNKRFKVDLNLLPEPFIGRRDSDVVILGLNPGIGAGDAANNRREPFRRRLFACLHHGQMAFPFHHLDPEENGPGSRWWRRVAGPLLATTDREVLARNLLCLEFFPYHSRSFGHVHLRLPSQDYTFQLLRDAMARGAVVIALRSMKIWTGAVPELAEYPNCFPVRVPRSPTISEGQCGKGFSAAMERIRGWT